MIRILILIMLAFALYFFLHDDRPDVGKDIRAAQEVWEESELKKFFK